MDNWKGFTYVQQWPSLVCHYLVWGWVSSEANT